MARTPMARLLWLNRTRFFLCVFFVPTKFFRSFKKTNIQGEILILSRNCMLCVHIRIASSRRFYWVHSTYKYYVETRKDFPKLSLFASWPGALINPLWLELPIFQTNVHGLKYVGAIGVRLCYICWLYFTKVTRPLSESATALQSTLIISNSETIDTFIWDESCFI